MINRIGNTARDDIKKIVKNYVENGLWATRIYAAACLGTVTNINICETNVMLIEDIFRYGRQMEITDRDLLAKSIASCVIMKMEELARYEY